MQYLGIHTYYVVRTMTKPMFCSIQFCDADFDVGREGIKFFA